jgi:hypothetical protein
MPVKTPPCPWDSCFDNWSVGGTCVHGNKPGDT